MLQWHSFTTGGGTAKLNTECFKYPEHPHHFTLSHISPQGYCFPGGTDLCEVWSWLVFQDPNSLRSPLAALSGKKSQAETNWWCVLLQPHRKQMHHYHAIRDPLAKSNLANLFSYEARFKDNILSLITPMCFASPSLFSGTYHSSLFVWDGVVWAK